MPAFASIIVDIPAKEISRSFEYRVPESLKKDISIGKMVVVPFGRASRIGYVASFSDKQLVERHVDITAVIDEPPVFDNLAADLARWTAEKYICSVSDVIRLMVPPGRSRKLVKRESAEGRKVIYIVSEPKVDVKTEEYIKLAVDVAAAKREVEAIDGRAPKQTKAIRALIDGPLPAHRLMRETAVSRQTLRSLVKRGLASFYREATYREPDFTYPEELPLNPRLTAEQKKALDAIKGGIDDDGSAYLLQGVTGSGKTEVYIRAIEHVRRQGRTAIVLVPEIALTPQTVSRFRARFDDDVAVLHSGLGLGERYDQWRRIRDGEYGVVIGARSAIWAPVRDLGLIVVDEEHEPSYKQDRTPRYHARDVALQRAQKAGATTILGSATPSVESRYKADRGDYRLLKLTKRIEERPLPDVEIVDMRGAKRADAGGFFSERLHEELKKTLGRSEKVILFLNRRGFANFVICRDCGHVIQCKRCNVSLTYHSAEKLLVCHHCGYTAPAPDVCSACGSPKVGFFGAGTERIEHEIGELFPETPITRMDSDTTGAKDSHRRKLIAFKEAPAGILLGTQMIAKGLDFPDVTLVGIINADTALNLPDFRSAERTFQLLMQVGGRAGRGIRPGRVLVQTYNPEAYAIQALISSDYDEFYFKEISWREVLSYPPFSEIINIGVTGKTEKITRETAENAAEILVKALDDSRLTGVLEILGPAPAPLARIRNKYQWHLVIKTDGSMAPSRFLRENHDKISPKKGHRDVTVVYDVDPVSLL